MGERRIRIDRPIMLVGLMGAGKSTVGPILARRLAIPFADSDSEIEKSAGLSVAEIFERHGEEHFRRLERKTIARLLEVPRQVIAAGGGAFLDEGTRTIVLERCFAIWIHAPLKLLVQRLDSWSERPLLHGERPERALARLARQRDPIYAQAHLTIRSEAIGPERMANRILEALEQRECRV